MKSSKFKNLFAALAFLGFLLALTEQNGGPWAGTYAGAALLILGAAGALRTAYKINAGNKKSNHNGRSRTENEVHVSIRRRTPGGRDAA